jgi:hypothetical protein
MGSPVNSPVFTTPGVLGDRIARQLLTTLKAITDYATDAELHVFRDPEALDRLVDQVASIGLS